MILNLQKTSNSSAFLLMVTFFLPTQLSWAQGTTESTFMLEEITVTARRIEESLQDTPVSVSALTEVDIQRGGITSLEDVAALTPGLTFNSYGAGNFAAPTIRGLAQTDITNIENNVSVFLNGIYLSNKSNLDLSLLDFEQIEVVRGPQSSLYGRNSFAGSINYISQQPTDELEGSLRVEVGTDEQQGISGTINLPVSDTFQARFSGAYSRFDGTIANVADSSDNLGGYEKTILSTSIAWQPTSSLDVNAFAYYSDEDNDPTALVQVDNNCGLGVNSFGFTLPVNGSYCGTFVATDEADVDPRAFGGQKESLLIGAGFDYSLNDGTLSLLASYADSSSEDLGDNDFTSQGTDYRVFNFATFGVVGTLNLDTFSGYRFENEESSIELRYRSNQDQALRWSVGGFYSTTDLEDGLYQSIVGDASGLAPGTGVFLLGVSIGDDPYATADFNVSEYSIDTAAIFAEATYDINEKLSAALEARYTQDSREANFVLTNAVASGEELSEDYSFVTPRFILSYKPQDDSLVYGSIARGVKSGGFNNTSSVIPNEKTYDDESNWSYEVGYKAAFADGRVEMDSSIYYIDWEDLQITTLGAANLFITQNLEGAEVYGGEFSMRAALNDNFTVNLGYSYTQPEYLEGTATATGRRECGIPNTVCELNDVGEVIIGGNQISRTSKHQANVSGTYAWDLQRNWSAFIRADLTHQSKQPNSINNNFIDARTLFNGRIGISNDQYSIQLWGKNLTDENYVRSRVNFNLPDAFPVFSYKTIIGDTRTFGVDFKMNF